MKKRLSTIIISTIVILGAAMGITVSVKRNAININASEFLDLHIGIYTTGSDIEKSLPGFIEAFSELEREPDKEAVRVALDKRVDNAKSVLDLMTDDMDKLNARIDPLLAKGKLTPELELLEDELQNSIAAHYKQDTVVVALSKLQLRIGNPATVD